jgi:NAD(P) transhydrogenase
VDIVLQREIDVVKAQLKRQRGFCDQRMARFADANTIEIENPEGAISKVTADTILVACGTRPARIR